MNNVKYTSRKNDRSTDVGVKKKRILSWVFEHGNFVQQIVQYY